MVAGRAVRGEVRGRARLERRRGVRRTREPWRRAGDRCRVEDAARGKRLKLLLTGCPLQIELRGGEAEHAVVRAVARPALPEARVVPRPALLSGVVLDAFFGGLRDELGVRALCVPPVRHAVAVVRTAHQDARLETARASLRDDRLRQVQLLDEQRADRELHGAVFAERDALPLRKADPPALHGTVRPKRRVDLVGNERSLRLPRTEVGEQRRPGEPLRQLIAARIARQLGHAVELQHVDLAGIFLGHGKRHAARLVVDERFLRRRRRPEIVDFLTPRVADITRPHRAGRPVE